MIIGGNALSGPDRSHHSSDQQPKDVNSENSNYCPIFVPTLVLPKANSHGVEFLCFTVFEFLSQLPRSSRASRAHGICRGRSRNATEIVPEMPFLARLMLCGQSPWLLTTHLDFPDVCFAMHPEHFKFVHAGEGLFWIRFVEHIRHNGKLGLPNDKEGCI